ncbi:unnamed protein product [Rotaria sordida]|uniref:Uncharacterized protein n=2 Tax=Rotaria sordida TaxID=392033 RepID=A0A814ABH2_9BILA|nr:unnamed protein product [Rotaria sordida]
MNFEELCIIIIIIIIFLVQKKILIKQMKKSKKIIISRSSDYSGGGFGFTLRHFVIYPPSVSINDILQASYSVVIDEHQQKQLEERRETKSGIIPSTISSSASATLIHHQGEQQQGILSSNSMKAIGSDNYEWFFDHNEYDKIPVEINPQMPKLPPILNISNVDPEISLNNETKPSEIIQQIVRAAKRRWSSPVLRDSLSSLSTTTEQQTSKPINISVKRNRRQDKKEEKSSRSRSVDSSLNDKQAIQTVSSSTDSAVYSMSDISSSISTTIKKPSQSLKDISHFFHYFTLSNDKHKSKTLTNIRRRKLRKKLTNQTFISPTNKDDDIYERISNSSICFIDQSPIHEIDFIQQTSLLKSKLIRHENILKTLKQQINQVDQQLLIIQEDSIKNTQHIKLCSPSNRQSIKRRHTFNSFFDLNSLFTEKDKYSSSLYALQLL